MPSHLKALVRARMEKTGESHQAALRHVRAHVPGSAEDAEPAWLAQLLEELRTPTTFAVLVGRIRPIAGSADPRVAEEQARDLAANPVYYAETGSVEKAIPFDQYTQLIEHGAADDRRVQMIRSTRQENGSTVHLSEGCDRCRRWIIAGDKEREGTCFCGHSYRVVYDLHPNGRWSLQEGDCCMECGQQLGFREWVGDRQPWHVVNDGQIRCHPCEQVARAAAARYNFVCSLSYGSFALLDVAAPESSRPIWQISEVFLNGVKQPQVIATVEVDMGGKLSDVPAEYQLVLDGVFQTIRKKHGPATLWRRPLAAS